MSSFNWHETTTFGTPALLPVLFQRWRGCQYITTHSHTHTHTLAFGLISFLFRILVNTKKKHEEVAETVAIFAKCGTVHQCKGTEQNV